PRVAHAEEAVEARLGEGLAPGTASAQRLGRRKRDLLDRELAVGLDRIRGARGRQAARHFLIEGTRELIEPRALEGEPCGHGVTAEAVDEPRVMRGDRVEHIANVNALDGTR